MKQPSIFQLIFDGLRDELRHALETRDINQVDEFGHTYLHDAVSLRKWDIAVDLIERGADVNRCGQDGTTPLHIAAAYGAADVVEGILANGGNPHIEDVHGNQPLWTAVFNAKGEYDLVSRLMRGGADPLHKNKHGMSPLDFARRIGDQMLIIILGGPGKPAPP